MTSCNTSNFLYDFLLAGISASIGKTSAAPLERAKLLLQNQYSIGNIKRHYNGTLDCLIRLANEEGFLSLWRGNLSNVIRYFPSQALNFAFKDTFKRLFKAYDPQKNFWRFFITNCISGGLGGAVSMFICQPIDLVRTRLATDNIDAEGNRKFSGSMDCVRQIYKSEGIRGLFSGVVISVVSIFPYRAGYFGLYDTIKQRFLSPRSCFLTKWLVAQVVTFNSSLMFYPLDTIRRRIMLESGSQPALKKYRNSLHCISVMYKEEGIMGFYKGFAANSIRAVGSSVVLVLYDELQKLLGFNLSGTH